MYLNCLLYLFSCNFGIQSMIELKVEQVWVYQVNNYQYNLIQLLLTTCIKGRMLGIDEVFCVEERKNCYIICDV